VKKFRGGNSIEDSKLTGARATLGV